MSRPRTITKGQNTISPLPRLAIPTQASEPHQPEMLPTSPAWGGTITTRMLNLLHSKVQEIVSRISGLISFGDGVDGAWSGDINGQFREFTFGTVPNTQTRVEHGLNRIPAFFFVQLEGVAVVYADDSDRASWNKTEIYLKSNVASIKIKLLIV